MTCSCVSRVANTPSNSLSLDQGLPITSCLTNSVHLVSGEEISFRSTKLWALDSSSSDASCLPATAYVVFSGLFGFSLTSEHQRTRGGHVSLATLSYGVSFLYLLQVHLRLPLKDQIPGGCPGVRHAFSKETGIGE